MLQRTLLLLVAAVGCGMLAGETELQAGPPGYHGYSSADAWMYWYAHQQPWHGNYRHTAYGRPVSLVVPPIANKQTHYHWGVTGTTVTPIYHQFGRSNPVGAGGAGPLQPTPYWPSSTDQFGVYYVRGPW